MFSSSPRASTWICFCTSCPYLYFLKNWVFVSYDKMLLHRRYVIFNYNYLCKFEYHFHGGRKFMTENNYCEVFLLTAFTLGGSVFSRLSILSKNSCYSITYDFMSQWILMKLQLLETSHRVGFKIKFSIDYFYERLRNMGENYWRGLFLPIGLIFFLSSSSSYHAS